MIERLNAALEGRYRIERELGQGGMATVFLAEDLKHGRKVALKVLKPELAAVVGGERFLAEIRTTAQLQHPHILPLHDSGEADSFLYYVMPYVEGESLRDQLDREKELPVEEAVGITVKVAGALQAAHDRGVVHRDVKPANILLDAQGEPLIADFGIALAVQEAGGGRLTETGLSLGTPYYMSPEQATGDRDPDARSDVYAVGAVLYELLVGEPPFVGSTAQSVLAKILTGEVTRPSLARKSIPGHVDAAVLTALERLPADRFPSAGAFAAALGDPGYRRPGSEAAVTGPRPIGRFWIPRVAAALLLVVVGAVVGGLLSGEAAPADSELLADLGVHADPSPGVVLAPNGGVVFREAGASDWPLFLRRPGSLEPVELGDRGFAYLRVSPDGRFLALGGVGGIQRVPIEGGEGVEVLPPPEPAADGTTVYRFPAFWTEEGLFLQEIGFGGPTSEQRIVRLDPTSRDLEVVLDASEWPFSLGRATPGPDGLLFLAVHRAALPYDGDTTRVLAVRPETGDTALAVSRGGHPRWVDPGHLVYLAPDGAIMAQPWDPREMRGTAPAFDLGLSTGAWHANAQLFDVNGDRLAWIMNAVSDLGGSRTLEWVDPETGRRDPLRLPSGAYVSARLSPDGDKVALREGIGPVPRRVAELSSGRSIDLEGPNAAGDGAGSRIRSPVWSPDSEALAWITDGTLVVARGSDYGVRTEHPLDIPTRYGSDIRLMGWPAADLIVGYALRFSSDRVSVQEPLRFRFDGEEWRLEDPDRRWDEFIQAISPDGRWAATTESFPGSRRTELWIRPWPSMDGGILVAESDAPGFGWGEAMWTQDGRTFLHVEADSVVLSDVSASGPNLQVDFRTRIEVPGPRMGDDVLNVAPDGRLLGASITEASWSLPVHEQNRVMLLTGLRERIRRMDPAGGGGS